MEIATIMKTLIECENKDSKIIQAYKNSLNGTSLDTLFSDLKDVTGIQYDWSMINQEKEYLNVNRRDIIHICDTVAKLLGDRIEEICVVATTSKPSQFEDYCPFKSDDLVVYSKKPIDTTVITQVKYDGDLYETVECKPENTPYYNIYCTSLTD